jgi:hypothetical protein
MISPPKGQRPKPPATCFLLRCPLPAAVPAACSETCGPALALALALGLGLAVRAPEHLHCICRAAIRSSHMTNHRSIRSQEEDAWDMDMLVRFMAHVQIGCLRPQATGHGAEAAASSRTWY